MIDRAEIEKLEPRPVAGDNVGHAITEELMAEMTDLLELTESLMRTVFVLPCLLCSMVRDWRR